MLDVIFIALYARDASRTRAYERFVLAIEEPHLDQRRGSSVEVGLHEVDCVGGIAVFGGDSSEQVVQFGACNVVRHSRGDWLISLGVFALDENVELATEFVEGEQRTRGVVALG